MGGDDEVKAVSLRGAVSVNLFGEYEANIETFDDKPAQFDTIARGVTCKASLYTAPGDGMKYVNDYGYDVVTKLAIRSALENALHRINQELSELGNLRTAQVDLSEDAIVTKGNA